MGRAGTRKGEGAARVDRDGVADTMVREAARITREIDGWLREGGGCRGFTRVAVGLLKHREAARLKREGHWLGERKGDRVIREAVRLVTEREVKRLERERAARNWVVERSEREREREVERERELERLERERLSLIHISEPTRRA